MFSDELIERVKQMILYGWKQADIARELDIKPIWVTAIKQDCKSMSEYIERLVVNKGFNSLNDYKKHKHEKRKGYFPTYTAYNAKKHGFESVKEYNLFLAMEKGFDSYTARQKQRAKDAGFESLNDYHTFLAQKKGFKSECEYRNHSKLKEQLKVLINNGMFEFKEGELENIVSEEGRERIIKLSESETSVFCIENGIVYLKKDHLYIKKLLGSS